MKLCELQPRNDFVIIELFPNESKTKGGILLPDSNKKSQKATVCVVGKKVLDLNVGDVVLIQQFAGEQVDNNEGLRAVREDSIIGIFVK